MKNFTVFSIIFFFYDILFQLGWSLRWIYNILHAQYLHNCYVIFKIYYQNFCKKFLSFSNLSYSWNHFCLFYKKWLQQRMRTKETVSYDLKIFFSVSYGAQVHRLHIRYLETIGIMLSVKAYVKMRASFI